MSFCGAGCEIGWCLESVSGDCVMLSPAPCLWWQSVPAVATVDVSLPLHKPHADTTKASPVCDQWRPHNRLIVTRYRRHFFRTHCLRYSLLCHLQEWQESRVTGTLFVAFRAFFLGSYSWVYCVCCVTTSLLADRVWLQFICRWPTHCLVRLMRHWY